jgi:hypothetical protein
MGARGGWRRRRNWQFWKVLKRILQTDFSIFSLPYLVYSVKTIVIVIKYRLRTRLAGRAAGSCCNGWSSVSMAKICI